MIRFLLVLLVILTTRNAPCYSKTSSNFMEEVTSEKEEYEVLGTEEVPLITEDPFSMDLNGTDSSWIMDAVRDVAYYLRAHKFNEWDRRYYKKESEAPNIFHYSFPKPPLRSLHWEVRQFCELGFITCLKYLAGKARRALVPREEDSVYIILDQKWFDSSQSQQILSVNEQCRKSKFRENNLGKPFQGPLERMQWRSTASYYMCWFTTNEVKALRHFNETCDNFANCINPWFGLYNNDPRALDEVPFACALYSFCPDTCCTLWITNNTNDCWERRKDNPCFEGNPAGQRHCSLVRSQNREFNDIVLNRWNVTCSCSGEGVEWNSRYGMCIDVDECLLGMNNCTDQTQECINLYGSFRCVCSWGYIWDDDSQSCIESHALTLITYTKVDDARENTAENESSFVKKILSFFNRKN